MRACVIISFSGVWGIGTRLLMSIVHSIFHRKFQEKRSQFTCEEDRGYHRAREDYIISHGLYMCDSGEFK
jgi:hypothetical protein